MIDLSQTQSASPRIQWLPTDPGLRWVQDPDIALDAPPDDDIQPLPEAQWPAQALRTGVCGSVAPRVIALPDGGYRMYYTQILPRPGVPTGANDYGNATSRILSATSTDGAHWTPEPGVRLSSHEGGAGEFRVVCGDVVPLAEADGRLRMYYECCPGTQADPNSIRSAISEDGGLVWTPEPGDRFSHKGRTYASARIVFLEDGRQRLYCGERKRGMISALSDDGGLTFREEPGLRIALGGPYDAQITFAPEIVRVDGVGYIMYYAAYGTSNRAYIFRAESEDGLSWRQRIEPIIAPTPGTWGAAKCSEMCILRLPYRAGETTRYRMVYEACDGQAVDERGVWRIASATSMP